MYKLFFCLGIVITIGAVGFIKLAIKFKEMQSDILEVIEYKNKVIELVGKINCGNFSYEIHDYLNTKSWIIQEKLKLSLSSDKYIKNHDIIINEVDKLRGYYNSNQYEEIKESLYKMSDCLGKYIGYKQHFEDKMNDDLQNPFTLIREGVRAIVTFPLYFLYWTQIIEYSRYTKIKYSTVFKVSSVFVGTLGFFSTIITIVTGYEPFMGIIKTLIE